MYADNAQALEIIASAKQNLKRMTNLFIWKTRFTNPIWFV